MKVELNISTEEMVREIAQEVFRVLKPHLNGKGKDGSLLTVKALAKYLDVSNQWIYERVNFNEIPFIKIGKHLRFKKHDIETWLDKNKTPAIDPISKPIKAIK